MGANAADQAVAGEIEDQDDRYAAVHFAVARLAGVCDFAESQDGQGFNATDTWLGHVLAAMPAGDWTEDEALAAWDMLRKYRGQLDGFGIRYDELPLPDGADELVAARREQARERARQRGRRWREQQYRKARSYVRCDGAGEQVVLAFPFDPALVDAAKAIKGRHFDWDTKTNIYPFTSLPQIITFAEAHGIEVTAEVRALVPAASAQAQQEAVRPEVFVDRTGRVVISAAFDPKLNEALKKLNGGRSTWDSKARVHRPPVHRDPGGVLALAEKFGLSVGDVARSAIEEETSRQDRNQAAATAFEADPVPVPGLAAGTALMPQQYPVVRFAVEHRRVLIGDDMGWGKTLSSLAAVAADGAWPAVVVCRPSLTLNWAAEIGRFFPALTVHEASGTTPQPVPDGTDVIVIGSAALAARPRSAKAGGKEFGWVQALAAAGPKALIIDEGQDTKERTANRSQACQQLAESVITRNGLVLDLTGTAILNRPRELCQQLTMLDRIGEFGGPKAFLWRYCLSETSDWGASYNGARNLTELHQRLLRWGIMIRRSDDAKLGLPPCREHVLRVAAADLDPAVMDRYRQAEADLLGYLAGQARQAAERLGTDPTDAAVQATMRAQAAEHLVAINTLRQLAGHAKRDYVTTWIRDQVEAGEKVMVAAHHRDEVDHYAAEFGGLKLQGGQPVVGKEAAKAAFQQQPAGQAPVISVAIGAGGVGHTLTAARIGIQAEQAWTPGETQQMKKRLHRIGQDRPVDYYITVAESTIDEQLWEVVTAKQATLDAVLDGRSDDGAADDGNSVAAELTWRLTQQGLGSPHAPRGGSGPISEPVAQPAVPSGEHAGPGNNGDGSPEPGTATQSSPELCPGCGTARLLPGRTVCQGCGVLAALGRLQGPGMPQGAFRQARRLAPVETPAREMTGQAANAGSSSASGSPWAGTCARCNAAPPGPGGIICPSCRAAIEARNSALTASPVPAEQRTDGRQHGHAPGGRAAAQRESRTPSSNDDGDDGPGDGQASALREAAHLYLSHGLHPVPGWAAKANGECCCPRGADCPRPGKHPRSVHVGPGQHDYSWKPLACTTPEQIDRRFADRSPYATANLMLAIPVGMLVIDQDNDDGGGQAITDLTKHLGELPPTLAHQTPHGVHHIYHTPPGWTGRAWVGKDASNPLPTGIDLRVPGQILMAPPSQIPGPDGMASYGPASGAAVAHLPAAYLTAWTPPQIPAARPHRPVPVPPERADAAASYVHARIQGVIADLAAREPGGRNAAIYTAGLKVGSTLAAARTTPGAERAEGGWTNEAAEDALMEAAERNGYIGKHGAAAARAAVRSGLRNGLRNPRPLPDLTRRPDRPTHQAERAGPGTRSGIRSAVPTAAATTRHLHEPELGTGRRHPSVPRKPTRMEAPTVRSVSAVLSAAGFVASSEAHRAAHVAEGYQVRATPDGSLLIRHVAIDEAINGASPSTRIEQMIPQYARALQTAGFQVIRPTGGSLAVTSAEAALTSHATEDPATAANLDRQAEGTPQRPTQIAASKLFTQARAAAALGDQQRADQLFEEARQLDPRMQMLWDRRPTGAQIGQQTRQLPGGDRSSPVREPADNRGSERSAGPQWPNRPEASRRPDAEGVGEARSPEQHPRQRRSNPAAPRAPQRHQRVAGHQPDGQSAEPEPESNRPAELTPPHVQTDSAQLTTSPEPSPADRQPGAREPTTGASDWRDTLIASERREWQPQAIQISQAHLGTPQAHEPEAGV